MKICQFARMLFLLSTLICFNAGRANALCAILSASATPLTANTGTFASGATPSAQPVVINVQGTFIAALGDIVNGCMAAISFNRTSLPASMLITGGGTATLPYQLRDSSSGGKSLLYTGSGIPSSTNALTFSFPAAILALDNFSVNVTVWAQAQPSATQQAGGYLDNITIDVFTSTLAGLLQGRVARQGFTVTGTVLKSCTIGGVNNPAADTATIPITASGNVNTAPINRSYSNVFCNTPAGVQLTSDNGAVTTGGSGGGVLRLINYSASATFSGASASLNTAASPGASGPESGTSSPTTGSTPTGSLGVTITPQLNTQPLAAGNYADTLRITITPQ